MLNKSAVLAIIRLSVLDVPLSLASARLGVLRARWAMVSMTMAWLVPSKLAAPGEGRVSEAVPPEVALMVPPFNVRRSVAMWSRSTLVSPACTVYLSISVGRGCH